MRASGQSVSGQDRLNGILAIQFLQKTATLPCDAQIQQARGVSDFWNKQVMRIKKKASFMQPNKKQESKISASWMKYSHGWELKRNMQEPNNFTTAKAIIIQQKPPKAQCYTCWKDMQTKSPGRFEELHLLDDFLFKNFPDLSNSCRKFWRKCSIEQQEVFQQKSEESRNRKWAQNDARTWLGTWRHSCCCQAKIICRQCRVTLRQPRIEPRETCTRICI